MSGKSSTGIQHSEAYRAARKEFINCWAMAIVGLGVPLVIAYREWLPIMREELKREGVC
ncbi:MAG: hypothetical protein PHI98_11040 [Eubacteriales bacterium]|nr:hypothetical protein [Eubacteriales bacterium]